MTLQTVLGEAKRSDLGITLTHEHFSLDFNQFYTEPPAIHKDKFSMGIYLDNLGYIRQYPYSSRENLNFSGAEVEQSVIKDCKLYKEAGGGTIVENTSWGLDRNLRFMQRVSKEAGINVIAGTGHYVEATQSQGTLSMSVEEMAQLYKMELTKGCKDKTDIRCGFIGEVGSTWPITDFERRSIIATAFIQKELGCPVSFHPGRHKDAPAEILRIYSEAGGDVSRAVMSHLERTLPSIESTLEFAELGSYCQFDLFGIEVSFYQLSPQNDMVSDGERVRRIQALLADGRGDKVHVSHDIHTRHRLVDYGGHGYAHIPIQARNHMEVKGLSEKEIYNILVNNPATWLTGRST